MENPQNYILLKRPVKREYAVLVEFAFELLGESEFEAFALAMHAFALSPEYHECPEDKVFAMRMVDAIESLDRILPVYPWADCRKVGEF